MSITLTTQVSDQIQRLLESGHYPDADSVLREALQLLERRHDQIEAFRAKVQVGLDEADRGEAEEWTSELSDRLFQEAKEMYLRGEQPDPDVVP